MIIIIIRKKQFNCKKYKILYKGSHHEQNEAESSHDDLQKVNHSKMKIFEHHLSE